MLQASLALSSSAAARPQSGSDLPEVGTVAPSVGAAPPGPAEAAATRPVALAAATVLIGIGAGLSGMMLAMLLHLLQHLAFGYNLTVIIGPQSFLSGVTEAPRWRRTAALAVCGLVAGIGWWGVYAFGRPLLSIRQAVRLHSVSMPVATVGHALLQIVTVGLGSPLGREVAPREIGALLATWASRWVRLNQADTRVMVACGAGAGLAAVYNVPLAGAMFTLEVLLQTFELASVVPAVATSVLAAVVAWIGLGDVSNYRLPQLEISSSLVCWSLVTGPLFGYAGHWYTRAATAARARAPRDWRLVPWCALVFLLIGATAGWYPQLLGNGKGPMQLGLIGDVGPRLALILLGLKLAATTACLRAGAEGGMLTPGMLIGALLATVLGSAWSAVWPATPLGAFSMVGGAAFLSSSMTMPLTAIVLMMEFTHMNHDFLIPVMLAVGGATAVRQRMAR